MEDRKIDISSYSLKELREAWLSIDDNAYPDRAVEIYQRLQKLESEAKVKSPSQNDPPGWVAYLWRMFFAPRFYEVQSNDIYLEDFKAEEKEIRVKKMIEIRENGN